MLKPPKGGIVGAQSEPHSLTARVTSDAVLVYRRIPADEFSQKDVEYHRVTAGSYDRDVTNALAVYHRYLLHPFLDRISFEIGSRPKALDLGCGTGAVTLALAERGFDVVGVDHSAEMLAFADEKLRQSAVSGSYRLLTGDVRSVPVETGRFDCVTCQGLLHHLEDERPCLRELARALRPGGFFYISEPCINPTWLKRALAYMWHKLAHKRTLDETTPESVEGPIDAERLRGDLEELGLTFHMEFLTDISPLRGTIPDVVYLVLVRAVSRPWRRRRGDLVFVFGRKA